MMKEKDLSAVTGVVSNIQRFSLHDGPGIRTTVFLKGCPLRCAWCANPETQQSKPQLLLPQKGCVLCGRCKDACTRQALSAADGRMVCDRERCDLCGGCLRVCPTRLPNISGQVMSVAEVLKIAERDRPFYEADENGNVGGITLSGGEPLFQPEFTLALLTEARKRGIGTCIETTLHAPFSVIGAVSPLPDHFYCDFKHVNSDKHKHFTGIGNHRILENIEQLLALRPDLHIRIPVIPGFNDSLQEIDAICAQLLRWNVQHVELMRYHNLASPKYHSLGRTYEYEAISQFTDEAFSQIRKAYLDNGISL